MERGALHMIDDYRGEDPGASLSERVRTELIELEMDDVDGTYLSVKYFTNLKSLPNITMA